MRALEEVTLRVAGAEEKRPYPGLSSYTEADAELFYGREAEVEAMCRNLARPHLPAMIGPSGAGKSSFLRAGLVPALPEGWAYILCEPGDKPVAAFGQALAPKLLYDKEAVSQFVRFDEPEVAVSLFRRFRERHSDVLVILDQFEELFTLSPPEVQSRFAELLGRLAIEADIHVLLSMRDDFLFHCHDHPPLSPIFSELTPLGPPTGDALRRALVQPALGCGYRFEDESLVDEMLGEVSEERGALPLLAFAASRLWELRDREQGLLTRSAYERIGGVAGALAQHAEATLGRIGPARERVVREIFRNLVTAQATRAVRDKDELLSVFEERQAADDVLQELIDARLLTSFEVAGDSSSSQRVEIIHESLLKNWPRLARGQTQDADGAQLRDQLRQAASMWEERGHPEDVLWTGSSFREFELWQERYPGGLTATEEAFAGAMVEESHKRRRRRWLAIASGFAALLVVVLVVEGQRQQAVQQARRAEAAKILALGQVELESPPTAAVGLCAQEPAGRRQPRGAGVCLACLAARAHGSHRAQR